MSSAEIVSHHWVLEVYTDVNSSPQSIITLSTPSELSEGYEHTSRSRLQPSITV